MISIVVVESDPHSLRAELDHIKVQRDVWDLHYADGAGAALSLFDQIPHVDAVIATIGSLNGGDLLSTIRARFPTTTRIIVSGFADTHELWDSIGAAHHYLTTPIELDELDRVINHIGGGPTAELHDPVRTLLRQTDRLPSPPALFQQIVEMLKTDRWTAASLGELLSGDVALTAEILRLVNSSMFGYSGSVSSVGRAVSLLGVDLIRTLVLGNKLFLPHEDIGSWLDLESLDQRCKAVAAGTYALAIRDNAPREVSGIAYLTGMVNEVGLLVMARVPNVSSKMAAPLNTTVFLDVERAVFGGDRFAVGCHLLQQWGFQTEVIDSIMSVTSPGAHDATGLPWYLFAARQLILNERFTDVDLASPVGENPAVDRALDALRLGGGAIVANAG